MFQALAEQALEDAEAAKDGNEAYLDDLARAVELPLAETRQVLHDLTQVERLITQWVGTDDPRSQAASPSSRGSSQP